MGATFSSRLNHNSRASNNASRRTRWRVERKPNDLGGYLPLYKAALGGKWEEARKFMDEDPEALTAKITIASETALHIAVGARKDTAFVEKLIDIMSPDELALTNQNGETAFSVAAVVGNKRAAELLYNKNPKLPNIPSKSGLPIHRAAQYGHRDMVSYLLAVTKNDIEPSPFSGEWGARLLISVIIAEFYDIALELIDKYPDLATIEANGGSPLSVLAEKPNAFPSGCHIKLWPQILNPFAYWKHIRDKNLMHHHALELVKRLCMEITELDGAKALSMLQRPLHLAAKLGIHEIIEEIVEVFPPAIWSADEKNRNVFQLAVIYRQERVFNLIYQMSEYRHLVMKYIDSTGDNILHLAARLPPSDRLSLVSGAALQMQRELQWFKEVEKFVQPAYKTMKNQDEKTPAMVFSEEHRNLVKEGEKWMKDTATSGTVVAALIATIVFAAAITVPGGNDQNNGIPLFTEHNKKHDVRAFAVFGLCDAISLFSSVVSILMFLSIFTSRYSEADFLLVLPKRLVIGVGALFVSITSMVTAFGAALNLVIGKSHPWRLPEGGLGILPVTYFVFLQFPLLVEITKPLYGPGIFGRKANRMLH